MSVFLLPVLTCDALERMMNSFWWGKREDGSNNIHWKRWDRLCVKKREGGLGFKKIQSFNLAMLGKQGWRLVTNPDSLVGRIFKARYYPSSDFLNAKLGYNPSYVWRSVLASQDLIKEGVRWRVGSGSSIRVWGEPWIDESVNPFIETPLQSGLDELTVNAIMKVGSREWDVDIIKNLFSEHDQERILATPISYRQVSDCWRWAWSPKGNYTVKSGYDHLISNFLPVLAPSVTDWKWVWSLNVPPKVRNFLWRALSDCVPSKVSLLSRYVDLDPTCPVCHNESESTAHALVGCAEVRRVWSLTNIGDFIGTQFSVTTWWNKINANCSHSDVELAAMILWSIWRNRNLLVWKGKFQHPSRIVFSAEAALSQWHAANASGESTSRRSTSEPPKWSCPQSGWSKCNVDASCLLGPSRSGFGGILRDVEGNFVAAVQGSVLGRHKPLLAEALGMREVLSWLKDRAEHHVELESDSQLLVQAIHSSSLDLSPVGLVVDDCKSLIRDIPFCVVQFVYRSANAVAHELARAADSVPGHKVWDMSPPFISDVLARDLI